MTMRGMKKKSPEFSQIKTPSKIQKRGRPKGAEVTLIGLPRKKRRKKKKVVTSILQMNI